MGVNILQNLDLRCRVFRIFGCFRSGPLPSLSPGVRMGEQLDPMLGPGPWGRSRRYCRLPVVYTLRSFVHRPIARLRSGAYRPRFNIYAASLLLYRFAFSLYSTAASVFYILR